MPAHFVLPSTSVKKMEEEDECEERETKAEDGTATDSGGNGPSSSQQESGEGALHRRQEQLEGGGGASPENNILHGNWISVGEMQRKEITKEDNYDDASQTDEEVRGNTLQDLSTGHDDETMTIMSSNLIAVTDHKMSAPRENNATMQDRGDDVAVTTLCVSGDDRNSGVDGDGVDDTKANNWVVPGTDQKVVPLSISEQGSSDEETGMNTER